MSSFHERMGEARIRRRAENDGIPAERKSEEAIEHAMAAEGLLPEVNEAIGFLRANREWSMKKLGYGKVTKSTEKSQREIKRAFSMGGNLNSEGIGLYWTTDTGSWSDSWWDSSPHGNSTRALKKDLKRKTLTGWRVVTSGKHASAGPHIRRQFLVPFTGTVVRTSHAEGGGYIGDIVSYSRQGIVINPGSKDSSGPEFEYSDIGIEKFLGILANHLIDAPDQRG